MVELVPMDEEEFRKFREPHLRDYAQGHVRDGRWSEAEALQRANEEFDQLLPNGLKTPDHFFWSVRTGPEQSRVGEVWYAVQRRAAGIDLWVYWIGIDEPFRRRGLARETFRRIEQEAARLGAHRIALHVFGDNDPAQELYRRIGFRATNIIMAKPVGRP